MTAEGKKHEQSDDHINCDNVGTLPRLGSIYGHTQTHARRNSLAAHDDRRRNNLVGHAHQGANGDFVENAVNRASRER